MKPVCRIEIVIDALHSEKVVELLADLGILGYTLIRSVSGSGERGDRRGDDITGVSNNHYILTTCPPEQLEAVTDALRPLLERVGGVCLTSDARWLQH
ncbi:transcriptional regulator [bacterium]|nr:transcriptional regulator [bacterium]